MTRSTITLLAAAGLGTAVMSASFASTSNHEISVEGLRIVSPPYQGEQSMRAFNWFSGTALALRVIADNGALMRLDSDASELEVMVDDRGNDLQKPVEGSFSNSGIGSPSFSSDGRAALVELSGPRVPAPGAHWIRAKGTLVFKRATETKDFRVAAKLAKGEVVRAGPIELTIARVGKPSWGNDPFEIMLRATQDTVAIERIRFLDSAGTEIESRKSGTMRMGAFGSIKVDMSYTLKEKRDAATVEITLWQDMTDVRVPFDVKTSVGIQ